MVQLLADLFISLDGFAAGDDVGPYFGYGGPELDAWIGERLDEPQEVVLGRRTYEILAAMSGHAADPASTRLTALPKIVFSSTLQEPLAWERTRLLRGDAAEVLGALKRESTTPLRTMGSLTLVRSLLEAGLVDRLRLTVFPLVLGERGREPFLAGVGAQDLRLDESLVLDGRVVSLTYVPCGARSGWQ